MVVTIGFSAVWPRPQRLLRMIVDQARKASTSADVPRPDNNRPSTRSAMPVSARQGAQEPQDSSRKKRVKFITTSRSKSRFRPITISEPPVERSS